jgi:hypothetical protein
MHLDTFGAQVGTVLVEVATRLRCALHLDKWPVTSINEGNPSSLRV